jgi:hypothetical protein
MTAGAAHVKWAATGRGRIAVADMWARSADLSGDAVVVFFRALAAISQEELAPLPPVDLPRWLIPSRTCDSLAIRRRKVCIGSNSRQLCQLIDGRLAARQRPSTYRSAHVR